MRKTVQWKTAARPRSARADQSPGPDLSQSVPSISRLSYTLPNPAMASGTFEQIAPGGSPQRYHQRKLMLLLSHAAIIKNITTELQHTAVLLQKTKCPQNQPALETALTGIKAHFKHRFDFNTMRSQRTNSDCFFFFWWGREVENLELDMENVFLLTGLWGWLKPEFFMSCATLRSPEPRWLLEGQSPFRFGGSATFFSLKSPF